MTTASQITDHVRTECAVAELVWPAPDAESFRRLMIDALGRDCVCEAGMPCWLLDSAIRVLKQRALEDGLVTAFAAAQRDAKEGGGPAVVTVYAATEDNGLDGARVVGRVAETSRRITTA